MKAEALNNTTAEDILENKSALSPEHPTFCYVYFAVVVCTAI